MPPHPATSRADIPSRVVPGLTVEERRQLLTWLDSTRESGIDATEDLTSRPWPLAVETVLIGVFHSGETTASWLLFARDGLWAVVSVTEGHVMATGPTLAEALTVIHRPPVGSAFHRHFGAGIARPR